MSQLSVHQARYVVHADEGGVSARCVHRRWPKHAQDLRVPRLLLRTSRSVGRRMAATLIAGDQTLDQQYTRVQCNGPVRAAVLGDPNFGADCRAPCMH